MAWLVALVRIDEARVVALGWWGAVWEVALVEEERGPDWLGEAGIGMASRLGVAEKGSIRDVVLAGTGWGSAGTTGVVTLVREGGRGVVALAGMGSGRVVSSARAIPLSAHCSCSAKRAQFAA